MQKILIALILWSVVSHAEDPVVVEPEQVVTASPLDDFSLQAMGWTSESITKDALDAKGEGSLYNALNKYPGIQASGDSSGNTPYVRIRGSGSNSRTLMLFDGVPLNTQDGLGGNPLLLPMELTSDIDLIKGPSSLFYGSDAVGGAINLKSRRLNRFTTQVGLQSNQQSSLWIASPIVDSKKNFLQASIFGENNPGDYIYQDPALGQVRRDHNQSQTQRYVLTGHHDFLKTKISHQFIYAQAHGQNPGSVPVNSTFIDDYKRKAYLVGFDMTTPLNQYMDLLYKLSWVDSKYDEASNGSVTLSESFKNTHSITISTRLTSNHQLDWVTDYNIDHYKSNYGTTLSKRSDYFEHGLIWRGQLQENEFVLAGVRFLPDENDFLKNILLKQVFANYFAWASYSEGIRLPSFSQLYSNDGFFVGNPNLKPEKSNQIELGVEKPIRDRPLYWFDHMRLKLSLYTIDYSDFIQSQATPAPYSLTNIGNVNSQGVEILTGFDYAIYHGQFSYSVQSVKDKKTNETLPLTPRSQAYLLLGAQLSVFIFEVQNNYWSTYLLDSSHKEDSWLTTDFSMRTSGLQNWSLRFGVKNAFNIQRNLALGYPEPGRSYFLFAERAF